MHLKDRCYTETIKINTPMTDISFISNYVCTYYSAQIYSGCEIWTLITNEKILCFDSQHHHDWKEIGEEKKKKNLTSALGFSHLKIQRHLDVKLDFEFTYRQGYRAQRKCWPEAAEVGCRGHPWRSPKGCRQQHRLWGSAAHGAVVTQRRTSVGCPPPPHPQLVTDLTTAARDFSGNQGSDFSPPWKTYSSQLIYLKLYWPT